MCPSVASVVQNSKMDKRYPLWDCACALAMPAFLRRSLLDLQLDALNRAKCARGRISRSTWETTKQGHDNN
jgi:hypothetical protein